MFSWGFGGTVSSLCHLTGTVRVFTTVIALPQPTDGMVQYTSGISISRVIYIILHLPLISDGASYCTILPLCIIFI
jgi:hypothetical protein